MDILKPLGLASDDVKLPLSPRSDAAYARINEEFDLLYTQLQEPHEQAGQNHTEVLLVMHAAGYAQALQTLQNRITRRPAPAVYFKCMPTIASIYAA